MASLNECSDLDPLGKYSDSDPDTSFLHQCTDLPVDSYSDGNSQYNPILPDAAECSPLVNNIYFIIGFPTPGSELKNLYTPDQLRLTALILVLKVFGPVTTPDDDDVVEKVYDFLSSIVRKTDGDYRLMKFLSGKSFDGIIRAALGPVRFEDKLSKVNVNQVISSRNLSKMAMALLKGKMGIIDNVPYLQPDEEAAMALSMALDLEPNIIRDPLLEPKRIVYRALPSRKPKSKLKSRMRISAITFGVALASMSVAMGLSKASDTTQSNGANQMFFDNQGNATLFDTYWVLSRELSAIEETGFDIKISIRDTTASAVSASSDVSSNTLYFTSREPLPIATTLRGFQVTPQMAIAYPKPGSFFIIADTLSGLDQDICHCKGAGCYTCVDKFSEGAADTSHLTTGYVLIEGAADHNQEIKWAIIRPIIDRNGGENYDIARLRAARTNVLPSDQMSNDFLTLLSNIYKKHLRLFNLTSTFPYDPRAYNKNFSISTLHYDQKNAELAIINRYLPHCLIDVMIDDYTNVSPLCVDSLCTSTINCSLDNNARDIPSCLVTANIRAYEEVAPLIGWPP